MVNVTIAMTANGYTHSVFHSFDDQQQLNIYILSMRQMGYGLDIAVVEDDGVRH